MYHVCMYMCTYIFIGMHTCIHVHMFYNFMYVIEYFNVFFYVCLYAGRHVCPDDGLGMDDEMDGFDH